MMRESVTIRGADAVVKALQAEGVELVVGTIGHTTFDLADALIDSRINNFHPAVEYGGAFIAEGFNRVRGRVKAIVTGTAASGPPIICGLTNANADSIPLVAIVGGDSLLLEPNNVTQSNPSAAMAAPAVKAVNRVLRGEMIPDAIRKAFQAASSGRHGCALIEMPYNLMTEKFEYDSRQFASIEPDVTRVRGDQSAIVRAAELLRGAKRPAILAGGGVTASGAEKALRDFAEFANIPVSVTTTARGAFPDDHNLGLGHSGVFGSRCANKALDEADVLLAIGCRFSELGYAQSWSIPATWELIHVDIDSKELGRTYQPKVGIVGDARVVLEDILEVARSSFRPRDLKHDEWCRHVQQLRSSWIHELDEMLQQPTDGVHPGRFFREIRQVLRPDAALCTEPTQVMEWALQCFDTPSPNTHLSPAGWASIGWAVPVALGVKLAFPERQVVSVSGDWAFLYNIAELSTVQKLGLPVVCVVFDDRAQLCNMGYQVAAFGKDRTPWTRHKNPDFTQLGQAFGLNTARIESHADIRPVINRAINSGEPYLVSVKIDPAVGEPATGRGYIGGAVWPSG